MVGVPDEKWGQHVGAVIAVREGVELTFEDLDAHARKEIAGYKVPRSIWIVDSVKRNPAGKADYRWPRRSRKPRRSTWSTASTSTREPESMRTDLCERFGIRYPIFGFTPSEKVAAAISRAGGMGVLGCVRFNDPDELDAV